MIAAIKTFFENQIKGPLFDYGLDKDMGKGAANAQHAIDLAVASLLVEMMRADMAQSDDERQEVADVLKRFTRLDEQELATLMALADQEADQATSLYQFTRLIDAELAYDIKVSVVEMLWSVAYADGVKDKHEEHLVRQVADLLHVSHRDYIQARHRIEDGLEK